MTSTLGIRKTVLQVTILSEQDELVDQNGNLLSDITLNKLAFETDEGGWIGGNIVVRSSVLIDDPEKIKQEEISLGGDGSFFDISDPFDTDD